MTPAAIPDMATWEAAFGAASLPKTKGGAVGSWFSGSDRTLGCLRQTTPRRRW